MMDLHGLSEAVACTALSCHLEDLRATPPQSDLVVVTGKGLGSGDGGPILKDATRAHLVAVGGPKITEVPKNDGRFMLMRADVEAWLQGNTNK